MAHRIWDDVITEQDRQVYGSGVFGGKVGLGQKPALIIIDVLNKSIGDEPLPILEAIARYGKGCCGEYGWNAVGKIRELLEIARLLGLPIAYARPVDVDEYSPEYRERHDEKSPNWRVYNGTRVGWNIVDEIAPEAGDILIRKPSASAFTNTPLEDELRSRGVDTLLVTGCVTSGCVRATVLGGLARGFKNTVVEDAVYDRGQVPHAIGLFDMQAKYADVIPFEELKLSLQAMARVPANR